MKSPSKHRVAPEIKTPQPDATSALLVTDIQHDFCPGGALAVPGGDAIVPLVNRYIQFFHQKSCPVIASRDWHPAGHSSFKEQGGPWPTHCVQGSWGARFHPSLALPPGCLIISKATDPKQEAYSAFEGTPLAERLRDLGTDTLYITGIATDYCIKNTVLDACRLGLRVVVLDDAIKGIDALPGDCERAVEAMKKAGAVFAKASDLGL
ncbi:MAG: nicotinamidase [Nitrospira sp.]|nr:nicotinamidase [Nitrospira sp.]